MADAHSPMHTKSSGPALFRRLWATGLLIPDDLDQLSQQRWVRESVPQNDYFDCGSDLCFLATGIAFRRRMGAEGEQHFSSIAVPGDLCTYSCVTGRPAYAVPQAVTRCTMLRLPLERALPMLEQSPAILAAIMANLASDNAMTEEMVISVGRRPAMQRIAHLFCELEFRYRRIGLTRGTQLSLKLTQVQIGQYLALSAVHVNRVIQELRRNEVIALAGRTLVIKDLVALQALANFSDSYLQDPPHYEPLARAVAS